MALRRVLVKVSGERFGGDGDDILDGKAIALIAREIKSLQDDKMQIGVVIGGGNIVRGREAIEAGIDESVAHQMGMLATVINGLALQSALEQLGVSTRVMSAVTVYSMAEPYIRRRAIRHMEKGRVVILAAGTGNPFFTTDTAAALRAAEMGCDALMKGTQVDGVYSDDPRRNVSATRFDSLTYMDVLSRDLKVMDASAISLARENGIPIVVFSLHNPGAFASVVQGKGRFTIIRDEA